MPSYSLNQFDEFYTFYLAKHQHPTCRLFHVIGFLLAVLSGLFFIAHPNWRDLFFVFIFGYGFAWAGHYFYEKNQPASFTNPFLSILAYLKMCTSFLIGKGESHS